MAILGKSNYPLIDVRRHLETGPIVLVSSAWKGETNIMTMGWHMMMPFSPALFGCYIWAGNHSYSLIRNSQKCVINIPTVELASKVVAVGNSAGDKMDKFREFGLCMGSAKGKCRDFSEQSENPSLSRPRRIHGCWRDNKFS